MQGHVDVLDRVPEDPVEDAFIAAYYYVGRLRNAWHGSRSHNYFGSDAFHPDLRSAKKSVEPRRSQGSRWEIIQFAAVVVASRTDQIVAFHLDNKTPWIYSRGPIPETPSLREIPEDMFPGPGMFRFHRKRVLLKPHRAPGKWWMSVSEGGNLPLSWREGEKGKRPWLQGVSKRGYQDYVRRIRGQIHTSEETTRR